MATAFLSMPDSSVRVQAHRSEMKLALNEASPSDVFDNSKCFAVSLYQP